MNEIAAKANSSAMTPDERQNLDMVLANFSSDSYRAMFSEIMSHGLALLCQGVKIESLASLAVDWPGSTVEFQRELVAAVRGWESTITPAIDETVRH